MLALAAVALAVAGLLSSSGDDDSLGVAIAAVAAVFFGVVLAVVGTLWWLTGSGRRRALDGDRGRLQVAAALSLAAGCLALLVPTLLTEAVGSSLIVWGPPAVAGVVLVVASSGLLRSLSKA